jgi:predicted esterase
MRGWFSTGDSDPLRPASGVETAAQSVRVAGFDPILMRTFHSGHEVGPDERAALIAWWLHP